MLDAYIYDGLRTPFGRHGGALAPVRPDDLLAGVIRELVQRNRFEPAGFEDVVIGNTNQAGEDARNVARHAGLLAGLPESVAGITVNRLCGSGLAATLDAARMVTVGEGELIIAGGTESMSRAPFVMAKAEKAFSRDMTIFDSTIGARFPNPTILQQFGGDTMPETAQNVAEDLGISRESADAFAARSQQRYQDARERGFFRDRILAGAVAGVAPRVMGLGPVEACNKALARAGLTLEQMDVIEINEAFAAQVLGCCKQLGLAGDDERLNPNGGAIAVGHPLGASGARLALTATRQLEATGGRYALVSLCIGVGQGVAMVIERQ